MAGNEAQLDARGRNVLGDRISAVSGRRPPDLNEPLVRIKYETYWRDRERLDQLPPGQAFRRSLVPGEFAGALDECEVVASEVDVWRGDRQRGSGSVRMLQPVGTTHIFSDAEDLVNEFFLAGPPGSD